MRLVLGALAQGPKCASEVATLLEVGPGSASSALQRLERCGFASRGDADHGPARPPRYYYELTDEGRQFTNAHPLHLSVDETTKTLRIEVARGTDHALGL